jgi:3-isopropylmalate/(R)-2-methylmalate dehydratase large subunit
MHIVAKIGAQGARGYAIEFAGSTFAKLSVEARLTISNMAVESGARAALLAPDEVTFNYVREHVRDLAPAELERAIESWKRLRSDDDAVFDIEYTFDAAEIEPYVTWGTSPDQAIPVSGCIPVAEQLSDDDRKALEYIGLQAGATLEGLPIDRAFIGSCTNSRIEDLRLAASVLKGRKVAPGVRAMIIPGSGLVRAQAEREGLAQQFIEAGFEWRQPGCSMCLAMNDDYLEPGERCASSTNRNFEGRQGRGGLTHLMSPLMVAAAAIAGRIVDVRKEF